MRPEDERVREAYEKRSSSGLVQKQNAAFGYSERISEEREYYYNKFIKEKFPNVSLLTFIEVGAGTGTNLAAFEKIGIKRENIHANELLPERFNGLQQNHPDLTLHEGNAIDLKIEANYFDVVFQSTVFTSILDKKIKQQLAAKMWEITKPGGIVLWYDFMYDNPNNKDVKGISKSEIKELFPDSQKISFQKVTLAPPIGRRFVKLYQFLNSFSFLRTHVIAVIEK